jgi:hypothetical protein
MKKACSAILAVLCLCASAAQAQNLVQNPGFETGSFAPWVPHDWYIQTDLMNSGSYSVGTGCIGAPSITTDAGSGCWFYQDISTIVGATYTVSFWYRDTSAANSPVELQAFFGAAPLTSGGPGTCTGSCIFDTQTAVGAWTQVTQSVVATSSTMRLEFTGRNDPSGLYLDDISVTGPPGLTSAPTAIPTLSQWGMLLLVGLMSLFGLTKLAQRRKV